MKIICGIVLSLFSVLTAGDVSHLSRNYVTPKKQPGNQQQQAAKATSVGVGDRAGTGTGLTVTVTSEQQTLRELPVEQHVTNAKTDGAAMPMMMTIALSEELQAPPAAAAVVAAQPLIASVTTISDLPQPQWPSSITKQCQEQLMQIQMEADAKLATAINMGVGVEQQRQSSSTVQ